MASRHVRLGGWIVTCLAVFAGGRAEAGSHSWRVKELFSNADGTVQFVELWCVTGNPAENGLSGKTVKATPPGTIFSFPGNIAGNTSNKHILLATNGYVGLPGGPVRDYAIPDNFISTMSTTIGYFFSQPGGIYHDCTIAAGLLPTDGVMSISNTVMTNNASLECSWVVGVNSPTNYTTGIPGSINAGGCVDTDMDGYGSPGNASCPNGSATDCNDGNASVHPGAVEIPDDGIDQDCNGSDSITCFQDLDNDDYGSAATVISSDADCLDAGEASVSGDCNDGNAAINPNAVESCADAADNDCNGDTDCADSACTCDSACPPCPAIPTMTQWGVGIFAITMLSAGTVLFARRRRMAAE